MIPQTIALITLALVSYLAWHVYKKYKTLQKELRKATFNLRSAYVRFGKTFEQFVPFTNDFTEEEKNNFVFLGMPIDGVIFGKEKIKFVEIKTGESQLSSKQKKIKNMIEKGMVEFVEVRYNERQNERSDKIDQAASLSQY